MAAGRRWCSSSSASPPPSPTTARIPELFSKYPDLQDDHQRLHRFSVERPAEFWEAQARSILTWSKDFTKVMDCDMASGRFRWFEDGELNACVNCVDRHADRDPDKVALIWEKDEPDSHQVVTYGQLKDLVCRMANVLADQGVRRGDAVAIYMPMSVMAVASMLACARIGAVHAVVFAGFSADALASRLVDSGAVAVITSDEAVRAGKRIPLRRIVSTALEQASKAADANPPKVFVTRRTGGDSGAIAPTDLILDDLMASASGDHVAASMGSEDHLFLLYTSGSTGKPKGLAHSTAGYLLYAAATLRHVFGYYDPDEVFGCVADVGWITGHSYVVYGPLVNGGTSLIFESTPTYPNPYRYWDTVRKHRIHHFYCSPTAVRQLLRFDDADVGGGSGDEEDGSWPRIDLSSLKSMGSVGEPINAEAWHWLKELVGQEDGPSSSDGECLVLDTWWQTETGGICIAPRPSAAGAPIIPATAMRPMLGIDPVLMLEEDQEAPGDAKNVEGALCIKTPWPGIARTIFGDHDRYVQTYFSRFPGKYFTGDGARRDDQGYWQITGRLDDVINVTGHRLGTAEVEDTLALHGDVAEVAVVGYPHQVKGESVCAFVVLKDAADKAVKEGSRDLDALLQELRLSVRKSIAAFAVPDQIQICPELPKTRSGKIMRRVLKKIAKSDYGDFGDLSTLSNPDVVKELVAGHARMKRGTTTA